MEPQLPNGLGGSHQTSVMLQPRFAGQPSLYSMGRTSQQYVTRDAANGDYGCELQREWSDASLWSYNEQQGWQRHRDPPVPVQHASGCTFKIAEDAFVMFAGATYDRWLSRTIWLYNGTEDSWARVGHTNIYTMRIIMAGGQMGSEGGHGSSFGPLHARHFVATLPPKLAALAEA